MGLFDELLCYSKGDYYPFHMPGHKRRLDYGFNPYDIDITEIDGFDNLHHPDGMLKELQQRIAKLYNSSYSYISINGSTAGIMAAVFSSVDQGGKLLMARNCHKSVYHAAFLREAEIVYSYPQIHKKICANCGINPIEIKQMWKTHPSIQAVVLTSPTYEGIVSDIFKIAQIVHENNAILIVDEAHGAHMRFHDGFPASAVDAGADIVIQSLHKTLPSFTQTAVVHVNGNEKLNELVRNYLGIFQTSSPSYLLMAGVDKCINMLERNANRLFEPYMNMLMKLRGDIRRLNHVHLLEKEDEKCYNILDMDSSKLIIYSDYKGLNGKRLYDILREKYHLQMEMSSLDYIIAMTSIMDDESGYSRLITALRDIDRMIEKEIIDKEEESPEAVMLGERAHSGVRAENMEIIRPKIHESIAQAAKRKAVCMPLDKCLGQVMCEYAYMYPPGIPVIVPGEIVDEEVIRFINNIKKAGYSLQGMKDGSGNYLEVYKIPQDA